MRILIKGGRVIDPGNCSEYADIIIADGRIAAVQKSARGVVDPHAFDRVLDAENCIVVPGLIDLHVHFREPGDEHKETILTGCRAAVRGGFTSVCTMPNTRPVNDCTQVTERIHEAGRRAALAKVYPIAAISVNLEGRQLSDFKALKAAGAVGVSDDGCPVESGHLMRQALEHAVRHGLRIISHSEDLRLTGTGVMNQGEVAQRLGLKGIPNTAESAMVMRDIALSEATGLPLHLAHVSTRESILAIRNAKDRGVPVSAETAPHYFTLTDEAVVHLGANAKMNPPLRSEDDRLAIRQALADGTIDAIATDHAPHAAQEKARPFELAPNGVIGLETSLPVSLKLVSEGVISLTALVEKMSKNPARILGIKNGIRPGLAADITIIDLNHRFTIDADSFHSKSRNTPFHGLSVTGSVVATLVDGRLVYEGL
jgi:dihydroorotase